MYNKAMNAISPMQAERLSYIPQIPALLRGSARVRLEGSTRSADSCEELRDFFAGMYGAPVARFEAGGTVGAGPEMTVGIILSGGQAPGGHNVVAGLYDSLVRANPKSVLIGFRNGPSGLLRCDYEILDGAKIDAVRNTGGFDLIGSGRTKIETPEQIAASAQTARRLSLDALVIVGGDDSNTNAALLARHFMKAGLATRICGVPKTIDGDMKGEMVEASFGFDTATKSYSEQIGNLCRDMLSARKYWHFVKLMGRSASHIALECALQTQPNITLIGEEIAARNITLRQLADSICKVIADRAARGMDYGIALIPEGVVEFIPEIRTLIAELNDTMADYEAVFGSLSSYAEKREWLRAYLSEEAFATLSSLPDNLAGQFLEQRDPHGNVQMSMIDTEELFVRVVQERLAQMRSAGQYSGKFKALTHFFGYAGRCAFPSNFDADYCYALGCTAFFLVANGLSGYLACVRHLARARDEWEPAGVPLVSLMGMERRNGERAPVIRKELVNLSGRPFRSFAERRDDWALNDRYLFAGAIQYWGPLCNAITKTLELEYTEGE